MYAAVLTSFSPELVLISQTSWYLFPEHHAMCFL
jgi:hypothetical protein